MAVGYMLLESNYAVFEAIQQDFLTVAQRVVDDPDVPLRATHLGEPQSYGGIYPCWQLYKIVARGQSGLSEAAENMLAQEYLCTVLTVHPASTSPTGDSRSGTAYADDVTFRGMSAFTTELARDYEVRSRAINMEFRSLTSGSYNEAGQVMFWDSAQNDLWAQMQEIAVTL